MSQFLISAAEAPNVREWWVWEYDLTKPRNLEAADVRQHYAVKRLVGVCKTRAEAEALVH